MIKALLVENGKDQGISEIIDLKKLLVEAGITDSDIINGNELNQYLNQLDPQVTRIISIEPNTLLADNFVSIIKELKSSQANFAYANLASADQVDRIEMPELAAEQIISSLKSAQNWPLMLCAFDTKYLKQLGNKAINSASSLAALALIKASNQNEQILELEHDLILQSDLVKTSNATLCSILKNAIDIYNIEEVFSNYPWNEYAKECAAAAFHTVAALAINFGDNTYANEALAMSDEFEDSPRSLALKGFLALDRGETLEAVAQMVASLQEYERRKQKDSAHYLSFMPKDNEKLNQHLKSGLDALTKRENDKAAKHFSLAVFDFDSLYAETGLQKVSGE